MTLKYSIKIALLIRFIGIVGQNNQNVIKNIGWLGISEYLVDLSKIINRRFILNKIVSSSYAIHIMGDKSMRMQKKN